MNVYVRAPVEHLYSSEPAAVVVDVQVMKLVRGQGCRRLMSGLARL